MHLPCTYGGYFLKPDEVRPMAFLARHSSPIHGRGWLLYDRPVHVLQASEPSQLAPLLGEIDREIQQGRTVTGFVSYEGTVAIGFGIPTRPSRPLLAWFSVHDDVPRFYNELLPEASFDAKVETSPDISRQQYGAAFQEVRDALARGDTYQVNLTYRHHFGELPDPFSFFADRCGVDPPEHAVYIHGGDWHVLSFSPELFLERSGSEVLMRPMKGTARATGDQTLDTDEAERLRNDPKTLAENLMIVDMVRNDLGSVCEIGSVSVPSLMRIERHRRLLQAVSTVTARTDASLSTLLKAVLPVASVTGAPKRITCGIIERLERSPRNLYCGIIGTANQGGETFSVAIRTGFYSSKEKKGEFGVGSGVVWDSDPDREYEECEAKTDLLHGSAPRWALVESMRFPPSLELRGRHLDRMARSADELGLTFDKRRATWLIESQRGEPGAKLRLLLYPDGRLEAEVARSTMPEGILEAVLLPQSVSSADVSLRHKTTSRQRFQDLLEEHPAYNEVLLANERGEATEFTRGSLLVLLDGSLLAPHPDAGCLESVSVLQMVSQGKVAYSRVAIGDLSRAEGIWFTNSVIGPRPVRLWDQEGMILVEAKEFRLW